MKEAELRVVIDAFDADGDGVITISEFTGSVNSVLAQY